MSSNFNMHQIKRQARKEAWYGDSYNPFGKSKGLRRSDTFPQQREDSLDLKAGITKPDVPVAQFVRDDDIRHEVPPTPLLPCSLQDADVSTSASGNKDRNRWIHSFSKNKEKWFKSKKQTQCDSTNTSWELDKTELSWDPFGCLSEQFSEAGYLHRPVHSDNLFRVESTQQLKERK